MGFGAYLWTGASPLCGRTFSVWPCVSEALDCAGLVRVCISLVGQGFAGERHRGELMNSLARAREPGIELR